MATPPTAERGRLPEPHPRARALPVAGGELDAGADRHWRMFATPLICALTFAISTYLTISHFQPAGLTCPLGSAHGAINCEKVTTSPQSYVFGIPVAILGLAFSMAMLALCLPAAWRSAHRFVAPARLLGAITGVGMVCYLLYAELYEIHAICIWCTTVHVLTFILFVLIATGWDQARAPYWDAEAALGPA